MEQRGGKARNEFFAEGGIRSKGGRTDFRGGVQVRMQAQVCWWGIKGFLLEEFISCKGGI